MPSEGTQDDNSDYGSDSSLYIANIVIKTEVVGIIYYGAQNMQPGILVKVERDEDCEIDMWAVKVLHNDVTMGYIKREHSPIMGPMMDYFKHHDVDVYDHISARITGNVKWTEHGQGYPMEICFSCGKTMEKMVIRNLNQFGLEYEVHFIVN
jgi:hypothetical protein